MDCTLHGLETNSCLAQLDHGFGGGHEILVFASFFMKNDWNGKISDKRFFIAYWELYNFVKYIEYVCNGNDHYIFKEDD